MAIRRLLERAVQVVDHRGERLPLAADAVAVELLHRLGDAGQAFLLRRQPRGLRLRLRDRVSERRAPRLERIASRVRARPVDHEEREVRRREQEGGGEPGEGGGARPRSSLRPLRLRVVAAREHELERARRARLPGRLRLSSTWANAGSFERAAIVGTTLSGPLPIELHVEPDLSVLVEAGLEVRDAHQGGSVRSRRASRVGPREAALGDDPREAAALLGHGGHAVRRQSRLRRLRSRLRLVLPRLERVHGRLEVGDAAANTSRPGARSRPGAAAR